MAQPVCVGQGHKGLLGRMVAGKQAKQTCCGGKVEGVRIHHVQPDSITLGHLPGTQLPVAPQFLVEKRLLLLDEPRLQQQGTDLTRRADALDAPRLPEHACLVCRAQMRQHPVAQVDAFADVQRQVPLLTMEDVDARCPWQISDRIFEVLRVNEGHTRFKRLAASPGRPLAPGQGVISQGGGAGRVGSGIGGHGDEVVACAHNPGAGSLGQQTVAIHTACAPHFDGHGLALGQCLPAVSAQLAGPALALGRLQRGLVVLAFAS